MTERIPVEGKIGLYRDSDSTAIINCDKKAYLDYMKRKKIAKIKNTRLSFKFWGIIFHKIKRAINIEEYKIK